jgi:hypothetical protein
LELLLVPKEEAIDPRRLKVESKKGIRRPHQLEILPFITHQYLLVDISLPSPEPLNQTSAVMHKKIREHEIKTHHVPVPQPKDGISTTDEDEVIMP